MSTLQVCLFGKFCVQRYGQVLNGLDAGKVQELFCYLLLHSDHPSPREMLATLLWGDYPDPQAKKYLRKALWQLQTTLNSECESPNNHVLLVDAGWVQLNSQADIWCDVAVLEGAFASVQGVLCQALDVQQVRALQDTVQLYQGELLEGWYQDWCVHERERLRTMYLAMLDKLMGYCEVQQAFEAGLVYGMRILRYDRARECTHRHLMRLRYLAGDRTGALRQYEQCVTALHDELDVRPATSTQLLYEQLRADTFEGSILTTNGTVIKEEIGSVPLPEVLGGFKQLLGTLAGMQQQVQQGIETIEKGLKGHS